MLTTFRDFLIDPALSGGLFAGDSWAAWRDAFACALDGLVPPTATAADLIRTCTGRTTLPTQRAREVWCAAGRRSGKTRIAAALAVHAAALGDYRDVLAPGERGVVMLIAADRRQARTAMNYCKGLLDRVPLLRSRVSDMTAESIRLTTGVDIEVHTGSYRAVRGYTVVLVVADEVAFWRSDEGASNPDGEVLAALRPALATVPGALLVGISSPYARRGELFRAFERHHGREGDPVLTWTAPTLTMNPTVPEHVVADALATDPVAARSEWLAEWRSDLESYLGPDVLDRLIVADRGDLPPSGRHLVFVDPAGGSGQDAMALAVAHVSSLSGRIVVDCVRETRPPFSPETVVREYADLLRHYGVSVVVGDRFGGEWCREPFRQRGIEYRLAGQSKSDYYRDALPLFTSARVELPDVPRLRGQLLALERRVSRGAKDSIDHPPGQHDDVANVVAAVCVEAHRSTSDARLAPITVVSFSGRPLYRQYPDGRTEYADRPAFPLSDFVGWRDPFTGEMQRQRDAFDRSLQPRG
jgi:hypothetical protein